MLLFQQLLNLKTKPLDTAIDDWVAMTKKLKELAKDARDMSAYAEGTAWKGQNAGVTKPFVTRTAGEFEDAVTQASSITNLLRSAREVGQRHGQARRRVPQLPLLDRRLRSTPAPGLERRGAGVHRRHARLRGR